MSRPRLYINRDVELDWLIALEFGETDDGWPGENWLVVHEQFAYLLDRPEDGRCLGFAVRDFSDFDPDDEGLESIWSGSRFDAPQLGLRDASAGELTSAGLAYTLLELDRPREAYRHACAYTEIVPTNAWAWCYRGQASQAMGEFAEARLSYERALALEAEGAEETDSAELLRRLPRRAA